MYACTYERTLACSPLITRTCPTPLSTRPDTCTPVHVHALLFSVQLHTLTLTLTQLVVLCLVIQHGMLSCIPLFLLSSSHTHPLPSLANTHTHTHTHTHILSLSLPVVPSLQPDQAAHDSGRYRDWILRWHGSARLLWTGGWFRSPTVSTMLRDLKAMRTV
jgi:hypothetical protein